MKIGICDDIPEWNRILCHTCQEILAKWHYNCDIVMYETGSALLEDIDEIDILLLDIRLQDMTGIEIRRKLEQMGTNILIIFVTCLKSMAISAFGINVCGFVEKDHIEDELETYLVPALQSLTHYIFVEKGVNSRRIKYIQSKRTYSDLYLAGNSKMMTRTPLRKYEEMLSKFDFIRTHKSYLVNLYYVERYCKEYFIIDGKNIPISVRLRQRVKKRFFAFIRDNSQ